MGNAGPERVGLGATFAIGVALFSGLAEGPGIPPPVLNGLALVSLSVMAYAVLAEYAFNVVGATLFHLAINLSSALVAGLVLSFNLPFMIACGAIAALVAAVADWLRRDLFFARWASAEPAPVTR